jgi:hypothetical protein
MPSLFEYLAECRARVAVGEMTDDAERDLVQLEQDEAPDTGHSLTSASTRAAIVVQIGLNCRLFGLDNAATANKNAAVSIALA